VVYLHNTDLNKTPNIVRLSTAPPTPAWSLAYV